MSIFYTGCNAPETRRKTWHVSLSKTRTVASNSRLIIPQNRWPRDAMPSPLSIGHNDRRRNWHEIFCLASQPLCCSKLRSTQQVTGPLASVHCGWRIHISCLTTRAPHLSSCCERANIVFVIVSLWRLCWEFHCLDCNGPHADKSQRWKNRRWNFPLSPTAVTVRNQFLLPPDPRRSSFIPSLGLGTTIISRRVQMLGDQGMQTRGRH